MRRDVSLGPVGLLIWCGTLLGVGFPLSKVSFAAGVSPMMWALLVSMGASLSLLPVLGVRGLLRLPRGRMLRYVAISGLVSFAGINLMIFALVPKLGAGQVGMMFALSPVATLALSVLFGMKAPGRLGLWGIGLGLIGALLVAFGRGGVEGSLIWSFVGLSIPIILAAGNVYRTLDWPEGAHPMALAFWSHGVAIVALVAAMLWQGDGVPLATLSAVPRAAGVQVIAAALTFPAYFRLQKLGGPVLLSQIGYVAAAVGLVVGLALLGERYALVSWIGVVVTVIGIFLSVCSKNGHSKSIELPMPLGRKTRARIGVACKSFEKPRLNRDKVL
ncbi:DMT family transporter [Shimia sp. MMG029]|uniref:DMT family transporter n=1 Tax=Shimia sp. MMG029 TaxID=3021978 RepID=UPI0022FDD151|nr:DMT family transporter [Shimia sp. MMG029]MDA5556072.1 DMT family transporter [Shimia sp. MMG029]